MKFDDLSRDMICELKQAYLTQRDNESVSWSELIDADSLVSDDEIRAFVGAVEFSEDDFFCNAKESI